VCDFLSVKGVASAVTDNLMLLSALTSFIVQIVLACIGCRLRTITTLVILYGSAKVLQ